MGSDPSLDELRELILVNVVGNIDETIKGIRQGDRVLARHGFSQVTMWMEEAQRHLWELAYPGILGTYVKDWQEKAEIHQANGEIEAASKAFKTMKAWRVYALQRLQGRAERNDLLLDGTANDPKVSGLPGPRQSAALERDAAAQDMLSAISDYQQVQSVERRRSWDLACADDDDEGLSDEAGHGLCQMEFAGEPWEPGRDALEEFEAIQEALDVHFPDFDTLTRAKRALKYLADEYLS